MRKFLVLVLFALMATVICEAQTKSVSGTVIGSDGQPVPGATVLVKGTTTGTATDFDGKYSLKVEEGQTLVFSFIGLQQVEVVVGADATYDVTLADDTKFIEEVIVVAYGTAKKSAFTGSAVQVKADKIAARSISNAMQALTGSVAGVQLTNESGQPGAEPQIKIRGIGTMNASTRPLYVVDGVPYEGSISAINPQDIESMSVLKDAAASAIYGARGANGVVLLTTKKAQGKDVVVNVEARWGRNSRAVPNYEVMTDPAMYLETQYRALYNSRVLNGFSAEDAHKYADENLTKSLGYQIYTVPSGERLIGTNFKLNPNATLGYYDAESDHYYLPDDWYEETFRDNNLRQEYNLSASGTSERLNYYVSFGYLDDTGIVEGSGYKRYTTRMKGDFQAKDWLKLGANMAYAYTDSKANPAYEEWGAAGNAFFIANNIAPVFPMYYRDKNGNIIRDSANNKRYDFGAKRAFMSGSNPAGESVLNGRDAEFDNLDGKWYANLTPTEELTLSATFGVGAQNQRGNAFYNPLYGREVGSKGSIDVEHERNFSFNEQFLLTYKKRIADYHNIDILAGYESFSQKLQQLSGSGKMMYNPNVGELNNSVDPNKTTSSSVLRYATKGFLSRVQYDYDGKYFLSGSFRRDASSCFHPDNRWGNFGSIGAAWLIDRESFLSGNTTVNMLKLKASLGVQGNDNLGRDDSDFQYKTWAFSPYQDLYKLTYSGDNENPYSVTFCKKGNKDITWETSYSANIGADFELFGSRLTGTVEYFWRKTTDMLYNQVVPYTLGYDYIPMNIGDVVNRGVEFDITGVVLKGDQYQVALNVNGTSYKNEITDLHESIKENGFTDGYTIYRIGGSVYNACMPKSTVDHNTGELLYYIKNEDGTLSTTTDYDLANSTSKFDLGSTLPKIYGGFGLTADAYGFDFVAQFAYQLGGKIYDGTYESLMHGGHSMNAGYNWHKDILKAWTPENPDSDIPRLSVSDNRYLSACDRYLTKSNYLSFNNVALGYTMPADISRKFFVERLRLFVSCDNVALWSCRKGLDPRQAVGGGGSTETGNFSYSAMRTITGGLQLSF
ncbi:MAG: TonB-dependent receptor [Bacteroidales bacterium]|nr:TonB-dependent receptor [Bacteroidales bacterium]